MISPGATGPVPKLAAFTTPSCEIRGTLGGGMTVEHGFVGDLLFRGLGALTEKSLRLLFESVQPPELRMSAVVLFSALAGCPSAAFASPYPTKSPTPNPFVPFPLRLIEFLPKPTFSHFPPIPI